MLGSRKREIRIQADSFREKCKISRYGIIDLFKECDHIGYKLIRYPLGENANLGFAVKKDDDILILPRTTRPKSLPEARDNPHVGRNRK